MKYFTFFLACFLFTWGLPNTSLAQASCQPKSCAKKMADKAEKTATPYLTVDFSALTQPSCSKKSEAKAVKTSVEAKTPAVECKPACDPKDCPPVCPPGCCEAGKASAQKVSEQMKAGCDKEDCKKHC